MIDDYVCRTTLMSLAISVSHDPLIDRDFAPVYTQTDGRVLYYNAIQGVGGTQVSAIAGAGPRAR